MTSLFTSMNSVDQIRSEPGINLWVFNNTLSFEKGHRLKDSVVLLSIRTGNSDKETLIKIPASWAPINIGYYANKKAILESSDFLRAVNQGLLAPVTSKSANEFISTHKDAEAEMERAAKSTTATPVVLESSEFSSGNIEEAEAEPKVIHATFRLLDGQITANEYVAILKTLDLGDQDKTYIMKNVTDAGILAYVAKMNSKG